MNNNLKIHHLGAVVQDMDRTLAFYCDVLGAELLWESWLFIAMYWERSCCGIHRQPKREINGTLSTGLLEPKYARPGCGSMA